MLITCFVTELPHGRWHTIIQCMHSMITMVCRRQVCFARPLFKGIDTRVNSPQKDSTTHSSPRRPYTTHRDWKSKLASESGIRTAHDSDFCSSGDLPSKSQNHDCRRLGFLDIKFVSVWALVFGSFRVRLVQNISRALSLRVCSDLYDRVRGGGGG